MEYTKGEWYLEEETGLILSIPDGADNPVVVASIGGSTDPTTPKPLKEILANARLISAAPELYEALKAAKARLEEYHDITEGFRLERQMQQALAKADKIHIEEG